jgi:hypothetical protein
MSDEQAPLELDPSELTERLDQLRAQFDELRRRL